MSQTTTRCARRLTCAVAGALAWLAAAPLAAPAQTRPT